MMELQTFKNEIKELQPALVAARDNIVTQLPADTLHIFQADSVYTSLNEYYVEMQNEEVEFNQMVRIKCLSASFKNRVEFELQGFFKMFESYIKEEIGKYLQIPEEDYYYVLYNFTNTLYLKQEFPIVFDIKTYLAMLGERPINEFRVECMDLAISIGTFIFNNIYNPSNALSYSSESKKSINGESEKIQKVYDIMQHNIHNMVPILSQVLFNLFKEAIAIYMNAAIK